MKGQKSIMAKDINRWIRIDQIDVNYKDEIDGHEQIEIDEYTWIKIDEYE